jgi:hypothetical protein
VTINVKDATSGLSVPVKTTTDGSDQVPHHIVDSLASIPDGALVALGNKADAKSTATDTTPASLIAVSKQISASAQAAVTALTGTLDITGTAAITATDGSVATIGTTTDAKVSATDTTPASLIAVSKQISASAQAAAASLASGTLAVAASDGGLGTVGAKADPKVAATDTTPASLIAVSKQISASVQDAATSLASGTLSVSAADGSVSTIGAKADAKSTATDTTPVSLVSISKQISASAQATAAALAGTLAISAIDGGLTTIGTKTDAKNTATDTTSVSLISISKQISASVQTAATLLAAALNAGENHIGEVGGSSAVVTANFNRPANTTAYVSGQLLANSTLAGSVTPMTLSVARIADKTGLIRRARLTKSGTSTSNASFRVHLYKTTPTAANGDGGTFQTNNALNYIGSMDFDMTGANAKAFSDGVKCIAVPNVGSDIVFEPSSGTTNIFALLEARGAYTPTSGETFTLALEVMRD